MSETLGGFLNALAKAFTAPPPTLDTLSKDILAFRVKQDADRERASDHLYITDFVDPCLRRLAFIMLNPDIRDTARDPSALFDMDTGTAIHEWFQNQVLGPMGLLSGNWECSVCKTIEKGRMPTGPCHRSIVKTQKELLDDKLVDLSCKKEGAVWRFKEEHIDLEFNGIKVTGRNDGRLLLNGEHLLEIKSKEDEAFGSIDKPEDRHVFQGSVYADALGLSKIVVFYVNRSHWSQTKAFLVPVDPTATETVKELTRLLKPVLDTKDPFRIIGKCAKKTAARTKWCGARKLCFSE